jgi:hypothetical protein
MSPYTIEIFGAPGGAQTRSPTTGPRFLTIRAVDRFADIVVALRVPLRDPPCRFRVDAK